MGTFSTSVAVMQQAVADMAAAGSEETYSAGVRLFDEGRPADDWWVLLSGHVDLVRRIGHEEAIMATMEHAGQWAGGFRAWDEHGIYMGSARVMETTRVFRLPAAELGRFGEADELAGAAIWLLSDAASFTTGATLSVEGGFLA